LTCARPSTRILPVSMTAEYCIRRRKSGPARFAGRRLSAGEDLPSTPPQRAEPAPVGLGGESGLRDV